MKSLKEEVLKMSAKEIILTMVESLRHPSLKVDTKTYGRVDYDGVCYGCAATNFICRVTEYTFTKENITLGTDRCDAIGEDEAFVVYFQSAIDALRRGYASVYNFFASEIGMALIEKWEEAELPGLYNAYTEKDLLMYVELANAQ